MNTRILIYLLPLVPLIIRGLIGLRFRSFMWKTLSDDEIGRESHRTVILALAGFSFTGVMAVTILDSATHQELHFAAYFLLVSFLCYLSALNIQGYKLWRALDLVSDALIETAALSLVLALLAVIQISGYSEAYKASVSVLALLVWVIDFIVRVVLTTCDLIRREKNNVSTARRKKGKT